MSRTSGRLAEGLLREAYDPNQTSFTGFPHQIVGRKGLSDLPFICSVELLCPTSSLKASFFPPWGSFSLESPTEAKALLSPRPQLAGLPFLIGRAQLGRCDPGLAAGAGDLELVPLLPVTTFFGWSG